MEILDKDEVTPGFFESLREKFKNQSRESVGVWVCENQVFAALLFYDEEWRLLDIAKGELTKAFDEHGVVEFVDGALRENDFKERVISLVVPENYLIKREIFIEREISADDEKDIVYWEFQEKFLKSKESFNIVYRKLQDGFYSVFALEDKARRKIDRIFGEKNIFVANLLALPQEIEMNLCGQYIDMAGAGLKIPIDADAARLDEGSPAVFAGMVGAGLAEEIDNLKFPSLFVPDVYDWKRISIALTLAAAVMFGIVFGVDGYRLYSAERELLEVRAEVEKIGVNKTSMRLYNEIADDTKLRERLVAEKTAERPPLYGVLTHLGTLTQDGVIVKSVKYDGKILKLECEAVSETAMERFMGNLKERRDLFIKSPKSLKTDRGDRGDRGDNIKFSFSVDLQVNG